MTSATVGSVTQSYTWSGDGVRLSAATGPGAGTTSFLVDRNAALPQVALERDGTGAVVRDSLYGTGRIGIETAGVPTYEHADGLGSVSDLTSGSGASLAWSEYAPYGSVRSAGAVSGAPASPFGFTGQYLDAPTGLYHLRARQYDPGTGRFLSVDPVAAPISDPYVGAYVYVADNPGRYADPSGKCFVIFCAAAAAGAVIGGAAGAIGYTATVVTANVAAGNGLSLEGWDPGQAVVATITSAGAGAVCGATAGLGCAAAATAASEIQYQLSPGRKSPLGYIGAGAIGAVTSFLGGGSLIDEGPLRWDQNLVGRMAATYGLDWERNFASQTVRSSLTNWGSGVADSAWNGLIGDDGK